MGFTSKQLAYELYKLRWKEEHNISYKDEADLLLYCYGLDADEDSSEFQFPNGIYVCYDEFLANEYRDEEYMKDLLPADMYAEYLVEQEQVKMYLEYRGLRGSAECSADTGEYQGRILGVQKFMPYGGSTLEDLKGAFKLRVDECLNKQAQLDMDTGAWKKVITSILDEFEDYGKYRGVLMTNGDNLQDDNYIPLRVAKMIVKNNAAGIRYSWDDKEKKM